ncbi:uncharacterized protein [Nicotiana sylvestris]|uniref:uncharacterized protein n=1 Tax=Nicotiana sylvestris TaxID=4096 RepID=UPI00388C70F5
MRIAARNPERSRADERLTGSLRKKVLECQDDLEKSEASLAKVRAQLVENAEGWAAFVRQMKRKYEGTIANLKRKQITLENEADKQARNFKADREHCYALMAQMDEDMQQLRNQNHYDTQVLEARNQQIGRLLQEKGIVRERFQYNIDIAPDRNSLTNLKKKSSESFREYAVKWREKASRVKPPMDEVEMPVPQTRQNPASPAYRAGTRCTYHSGAEGHDTDDCCTLKRTVENLIEQRKIVLRDEDVPNVTNNPLPAHNNGPVIGMICEDKEFDPALKAIIAIADEEKKPKVAPKQDKGEKKKETTPPKSEKKIEVETGGTPPKDGVLYVPQGRKEKQMTLSPPRRFELNKTTQMYVPKGAYVMRGPIKPSKLNEPVVIGRAPQKPMKDPTDVPWNYNKTVVTYKGKEILGEVQENNPVEKYSNLEEVNNATRKRFPLKKLVSAEEAEAFFQNMKMADYEVIDQLRKFPEQVSLLALLMNSAEHQKVLIKTLNEAYVPVDTSVEQLERMAERFFAINQITFSKNDLPSEGAAHNKALHLTVKCKGHYVKRVMLDGGSGVDICPLSTLQRMKIGTEIIRPNNVCIRAFDGIKRDTIGEIDLILTIVPVDFEVTFQTSTKKETLVPKPSFLMHQSWWPKK